MTEPDAEYTDDTDRLHGEWNNTGTRRWCADCGIWVRLEDWHDHERELAKLATDGGREQDTDEESASSYLAVILTDPSSFSWCTGPRSAFAHSNDWSASSPSGEGPIFTLSSNPRIVTELAEKPTSDTPNGMRAMLTDLLASQISGRLLSEVIGGCDNA